MAIGPQHRVFAGFFLFAFAHGGLVSRFADLQVAYGMSEGMLGLTIIGAPVGLLVSLSLAPPVVRWLGVRRILYVALIGMPAGIALVPLMPHAPAIFAVLVGVGLLTGAAEVTVNVEADRVESHLGRRIMSRSHGFWSLGFFSAAVLGAAMRQAGVPMQVHFGAVLAITAVATHLTMSGLTPAPKRGNGALQAPARFFLPTAAILALCAVGMAPMLVEGAGNDWSIIYMRDTFATAPLVSGLSLVLGSLAMTVARLSMDPLVERFGPRAVANVLLTLSAVGVVAVGLAPHPAAALLGFTLMGIGASAVYPLAVSAAAQRSDRSAETNVASLAQTTFVVFFFGPPLLGLIAEHFGIRFSFLVCLPFIALALGFVPRLAPEAGPAARSPIDPAHI
jgi:MFS family permease